MAADRGQRIRNHCETIWGKADYDLEIETDDWVSYMVIARKDLGTSFGPPLAVTGLCNSKEQAWSELERMLGAWATQVRVDSR